MPEHMLYVNMRCFCPNLYYTRNCNVLFQIYITHENMMSRGRTYVTSKMCYVRSYAAHEYVIHLSELMLHTKMCNVRTYVTHEYEMFFWTYVAYENIICPNLCYTRKYYVWFPNLYYIQLFSVRTYGIFEMCNVRRYVTHEYEMFSARTHVIYENIICSI